MARSIRVYSFDILWRPFYDEHLTLEKCEQHGDFSNMASLLEADRKARLEFYEFHVTNTQPMAVCGYGDAGGV